MGEKLINVPDWREIRIFLALLVGSAILFLVGSIVISHVAINQILAKEAVEQAASFRTYMIASTDTLTDFLKGKHPANRTVSFFANTPGVGSLHRYTLFNSDGRTRFVSDQLDFGTTTDGMLEIPGKKGTFRLGDSEFFVDTNRSSKSESPKIISTVYLPLVIGEQNVGTLVAYVDQTNAAAHHADRIRAVCLKIGGLSALVFALPLLAILWQARLRRQADQRVAYMARFDSLTGLINRVEFTKRLEAMLSSGEKFAVHLVDLDKFKAVNDIRGHGVGDLLLRDVGERLTGVAGFHADVARLGGDEFAMLHRTHGSAGPTPSTLAAEVVEQLGFRFFVGGYDVQIGGSVGTALSGTDGTTIENLLRAADTALYVAKNSGRSRNVAFKPEMDEARLARLALESRLREASAQNAFHLHFQPIYWANSGLLEGFEALLRLDWPDGTAIAPVEFIPVAEEMGLIEGIGESALREACAIAKTWPEHLVVSVNVSAIQFRNGTLPDQVRNILTETGFQPHRLCLELTEGILIENTEEVMAQLRALRAQGVVIALDDFGTGYSSLSYLSCFPLDRLKIDKSLTDGLSIETNKSREITGAIISLGHVLNLAVTIEGVETGQQYALLRQLGCDHVQGHMLGQPMTCLDLHALIAHDLVQRTRSACLPFGQSAHAPGSANSKAAAAS